MAHFYGRLQGMRGEATRLGGVKSGLAATAASWHGAVEVRLYVRNGVDMALVTLAPWHGVGVHRTIYDGPVDGTPAEFAPHVTAAQSVR